MMKSTTESIAVLLSTYGAVLSTLNAIFAYRKDRANIVLKVRSNMKTSGRGGSYVGMTITIVTATNKGKRPVTIHGFGAKQLDIVKQFWFTDTQPALPSELTESQSVQAYLDEGLGALDDVESYYVWDSIGRYFYFHKASRLRRLLSWFKRKFGEAYR